MCTLLILQIIDCVNEKKHERGKLKLYGAIKDVDRWVKWWLVVLLSKEAIWKP